MVVVQMLLQMSIQSTVICIVLVRNVAITKDVRIVASLISLITAVAKIRKNTRINPYSRGLRLSFFLYIFGKYILSMNLSLKKKGEYKNMDSEEKNMIDLINYIARALAHNQERYSVEFCSQREPAVLQLFDKEKDVVYIARLELVEYDEYGNAKNL